MLTYHVVDVSSEARRYQHTLPPLFEDSSNHHRTCIIGLEAPVGALKGLEAAIRWRRAFDGRICGSGNINCCRGDVPISIMDIRLRA